MAPFSPIAKSPPTGPCWQALARRQCDMSDPGFSPSSRGSAGRAWSGPTQPLDAVLVPAMNGIDRVNADGVLTFWWKDFDPFDRTAGNVPSILPTDQ